MDRDSLPSYTENVVQIAAVRWLGACCWVTLGLVGFVTLMALWVPVDGVTDVPRYARSVLFLSLGHQLDDVKAVIASTSPPPPSF